MDTEKETVMGNHMQRTYHMWLTGDTQTFSSSLHTVTSHITYLLHAAGSFLRS